MMRLTKKYTFFGSRLRLINFVCMLASVLLHFHKICAYLPVISKDDSLGSALEHVIISSPSL